MNAVITGGGTVAPIDDVRHIANISTGQFAAAIVEATLARGDSAWHIRTPNAARPFARDAAFNLDAENLGAEFDRLQTLRERYRAVRERLHPVPLRVGTLDEYAATLHATLASAPIDVVYLAMAASDYIPEAFRGKLSSEPDAITIRCRRAPKVIRSVRDWAPHAYLVGFKLLSGAPTADLIAAAERSNEVNGLELTVANDLRTVQAGRHVIHLVRPGQPVETYGPDGSIAERLVDRVGTWASARSRPWSSSPG